jgi:hypothetical protein
VRTNARHARQARLPEIGEAGQNRIDVAALEVRGTEGAVWEAEYLCRAGVQRLELSPRKEAVPFAHQDAFQHGPARSVAAGAWRALRQLRTILDVGAT